MIIIDNITEYIFLNSKPIPVTNNIIHISNIFIVVKDSILDLYDNGNANEIMTKAETINNIDTI